jgi:hypothetical protein
MFAMGLIWIVNSPQKEETPNPTPIEEATKSGRSLIGHVQGFFQDFEKTTYSFEKVITSDGQGENPESKDKASFSLTFVGILKFLNVLILVGIIPLGVASSRARGRRNP